MNDAVITLNGLEKRFPGMDKPAVAPLDCTIHAGYVTGLVGPDGAGKTTLMRMLAGLLKPDSGNATVIGFDPIKNDGALHAVLGYMPQQPKYKVTHIDYGFLESFPAGVKYGCKVLSGYVGDMKYLFSSEGAKSLGGFGAIGSLFPSQWDWHSFWLMTAFLSIILAFMNILPIPALDGGHVLFLLYEMIARRKPSENFMIYAEYIGIGVLLLLMVVANLNDILRFLHII